MQHSLQSSTRPHQAGGSVLEFERSPTDEQRKKIRAAQDRVIFTAGALVGAAVALSFIFIVSILFRVLL
jgi:hypothetical protein